MLVAVQTARHRRGPCARKAVLAVYEDRRRPCEAEPLSLLHRVDAPEPDLRREPEGAQRLGRPLECQLPIRAAVEVEHRHIHGSIVDLPVRGKVKPYVRGVRISELAVRAGVTAKAVRYYEQVGVLPPPSRTPSDYREYGEEALERLAFIRAAQAVGLTLAEIRGVIEVRDGGTPPCSHVLALLQRKVDDIEAQITALVGMRQDLLALVARAAGVDPSDCASDDGVCVVIART